jgi:hypothetical protein
MLQYVEDWREKKMTFFITSANSGLIRNGRIGPGQARSNFATAGAAVYRQGSQKSDDAGPGRKGLMDKHSPDILPKNLPQRFALNFMG